MKLTKEQALDLAAFGSIELNDGRSLRFRREPDDSTTINDFDCYGTIQVIRKGDDPRPHNFDGMAEKLNTYRDSFWWQPPADLRKVWNNYEHKNELRRAVLNILEFGFELYWLELCEGSDAYGNPVVVDYAVIGGCDPLPDDSDVAEKLMDMAYQIEYSASELTTSDK